MKKANRPLESFYTLYKLSLQFENRRPNALSLFDEHPKSCYNAGDEVCSSLPSCFPPNRVIRLRVRR
jgi:hypothetical protein